VPGGEPDVVNLPNVTFTNKALQIKLRMDDLTRDCLKKRRF